MPSGSYSMTSDSTGYGGATDGYCGMTDGYCGTTDGYGGTTDGYGGTTDGYGGTTDGYGGSSSGYGGTSGTSGSTSGTGTTGTGTTGTSGSGSTSTGGGSSTSGGSTSGSTSTSGPVITSFTDSVSLDVWSFSGQAIDSSANITGCTVYFGGALQGDVATIQCDGNFMFQIELPSGLSGSVTAQFTDSLGQVSNLATATLI